MRTRDMQRKPRKQDSHLRLEGNAGLVLGDLIQEHVAGRTRGRHVDAERLAASVGAAQNGQSREMVSE